MYIYIIKQTEKHKAMKNLLNQKLTAEQKEEINFLAETKISMYGGSKLAYLKSAMREVFMQAGLVEKESIDFSKMASKELRGYALNDNDLIYDNKSRKYVKF